MIKVPYFSFALMMTISIPLVAAPIIEIEIRDHLFYPSEIEIPANTKVKLIIINQDATAEEFESYELNREKVIPGNSKGIIFIGPLPAGDYPFFGEFFPKTAQGKVIVK
ncbi:MAG: hypothetical protein COB23_07970 [Methylophaga sp.]|nr:MAG: hypothetical protein COB23_07970 [Methylophaga sp.]